MNAVNVFPSTFAFCKVCAHDMTSLAAETDTPPTAGDVVMCAYCGALYIVDDSLAPVLADGPARELLVQSIPQLRIALVQRAVQMGSPDPVDLKEMAGFLGPIRDELVIVRARISQLMTDAPQDRAGLTSARRHRDALRRLLAVLQEFIDTEVLAQSLTVEVDHA